MTVPYRQQYLTDQYGFRLLDPVSQTYVGRPTDDTDTRTARLVYALPLNQQGGLNDRYRPPSPHEVCEFGISFDYILPEIVGIASGTLQVFTNTVPPAPTTDWTMSAVEVRGRSLYATLQGGVYGTDYQFTWSAVDTNGNAWPRTVLCLCAATS